MPSPPHNICWLSIDEQWSHDPFVCKCKHMADIPLGYISCWDALENVSWLSANEIQRIVAGGEKNSH